MEKKEEKSKKVICLPGMDEYPDMSITELTKIKKKIETLLDFISRIIRSKIQK